MVITDIRKNVKNPNRFSVFIDEKFAFSLNDALLIKLSLAKGDSIDKNRVDEIKVSIDSNNIYSQVLKYVSTRLKTSWEVENYLERKKVSPTLIQDILNKLSNMDLVNDESYIRSFIRTKQAIRPASKIKIEYELRKKHIDQELIKKVMEETDFSDRSALVELIEKKRGLYKDKTKLTAYLVRQGFNYGDIKKELTEN
jgi:regulatory protein